MGIYVIKMPDIGEGIAEVELVEWHVKEGDEVAEDQVLADVMTDKATVQVPSPVHGRVLALGGRIGEVMPVGSPLIRLEVEGPGNVTEEGAAPAVTTVASEPRAAEELVAASTAVQDGRSSARAAEEPGSAAAAMESGKPAGPSTPAPARRPGRPLASPSVRRRAQEEGIDLRFVSGTGPVGQITHEDLDIWLQQGRQGPGAHATASSTTGPGGYMALAPREGVEEVPVVGLRRKIAEKMQAAKRHIPHFTYVEEIDVTELEVLRGRLNERWGATRGKLTMLPFLIRAMVLAVKEFPQMNARFDDEKGVVTRHAAVHLGVAAQTGNGLMVPVLRHAEALDLWACAREVSRLAEAVRDGTAKRDELSGSTITVTSLGALGGIVSTPVINHPEVAIVGVNRIVEKPVVLNGAIVVRKTMNLSSSFDHRVVDGMHAAQFIQCIRSHLECPATLFLE